MTAGYWPEHCTRETGPVLIYLGIQGTCGAPVQALSIVGTEMLGYCTTCRTAYILLEQPIEEDE